MTDRLRSCLRIGAGLMLCAALLIAHSACNSPFIPIPPPADPTFTSVSVPDGMGGSKVAWQVSGGPAPAMAGAKVFVFNDSLQVGVIARAQTDGSYVTGLIDGAADDHVELWFETAKTQELSQVLCVQLKAGVANQHCP